MRATPAVLVPQLILLSVTSCRSAPPSGIAGAEAEALARQMQAAVHGDAWAETGAVTWNFRGTNLHLWDRRRGFSSVEWDEHRALFDVVGRRGVVFSDGRRLTGERAREKLDAAHAKWTNDAFWLNPVMKAFDPGTTREIVAPSEGRPGLLVRYASGGRTPGDVYLWWLDPGGSGRPVAWQMWTSNIPIGGVEATWEGWTELATGALVSTKHETPLFGLDLTDVAGARDLSSLRAGEDPFAALVACLADGSCDAL